MRYFETDGDNDEILPFTDEEIECMGEPPYSTNPECNRWLVTWLTRKDRQ